MVCLDRRIWLQLDAQQDLRQQEIRTQARVDQAGIFTDPTQPGSLRQLTFQGRLLTLLVVQVRDGGLDQPLQMPRQQ